MSCGNTRVKALTQSKQSGFNMLQVTSNALVNPKELAAYNKIREQFSGMTLQEAYNATQAVKDYLGVIGEEVDCNEFVFQ